MDECRIPVVWGLDEKYVLPAFVAMHSILAHSNKEYIFYILTADPVAEQAQEYMALLKEKYGHFSVLVKEVDRELFKSVRINSRHLSVAAFFRLLIPDLLCDHDKCIYLDCDVLVNGDLAELFQIELTDDYLAGVKDCHVIENTPKQWEHEKVLGIPSRDKYINSGVMLMNLKKIREDMLVKRFLIQMGRENWLEDQDVLNCCCYPHIKTIPLKYNLFHFYYGKSIRFLYGLDYERQDFEFDTPFILHMGGEWKPWKNRKVKGADQWWKAAEIFKGTRRYQAYYEASWPKDNIDAMFEFLNENRKRQFVIWGYTQNGKELCHMMKVKGYTNIVAFADNDVNKWKEIYCDIPVMGMEQILDRFSEVCWIISNQLAFEEVQKQIIGYGVDAQFVTRYISWNYKLWLLALDEKFYDQQIDKIVEFEYVKEIPECAQRKEYILQILSEPEHFLKEYEYLDKKYHFDYWYMLRHEDTGKEHREMERNEDHSNYRLL